MSRRRYLSTGISTDTRVNRLAMKSDFAALLYTWMIPHCGDDASIPADAEEILLIVMPGRRDKTIEDIEDALQLIEAEGLIEWNEDENTVNYPVPAFYKYQTYITEGRRKVPQNDDKPRTFQNGGDNSADQRGSAQNATSLKSSLTVKSSFSSLVNTPLPPKGGCPKPKPKINLDGFREFYELYPKRVKPAVAERAWAKLKPEERQAAIDAIERQQFWPAMTGDPEFIPHPSTWLNARSWEDEPPKFTNGGSINGHVPRRTGGAAAGGMTPQEFDAHIAELERQGL